MTALAKWLQVDRSTVSKRLSEHGTALCLDFLDEVSAFYQKSVSEIVQAPEAVFQSVSPLEASLLDRFRKMNELQRRSLLTVLDWRGDVPLAKRKSLSHEDAQIVALYNGVPQNVQAAVLQMLLDHPQAKTGLTRHPRRTSEGT